MPIPYTSPKAIKFTPGQKNTNVPNVAPPKERGFLASAAGTLLDPVAKLATEGGQFVGKEIVRGVEHFQSSENRAKTEANLQNALNQPSTVPGLGTQVKPLNQVGGKDIAGQALGVAGLATGNPMLGGAFLGAGSSLEGGGSPADVVINGLGGALMGKVLDLGFKAVAPQVEKAIQKYGTPMFEKLSAHIPESLKASYQAMAAKVKLPTVDIKGLNKAQEFASNLDKKISGKISTAARKGSDKFMGKIGPKTKQAILSTPESEVYKLRPNERKLYFDEQKAKLQSGVETKQLKTKEDFTKKTSQLQTEAENLKKELDTTSRDKVIELRPKIREALGRQSQEYRRLVDAEIAPVKGKQIDATSLKNFISNKFVDNPELANAINSKLGVPADGMTTIGKIYDKTVSLRQDIGSAAKKGIATYTSDEKLIDDSISTLNDFLKTQGVDLKNARQFWAKYAPIRNQLVTEAKPFLQADIQTKTFSNTLSRVASGKDVNNEIFVKEVNNLLGEDVTKESKDVFSKISENEKKTIATKADAEIKKMEIELNKEKELGKLSDREFEIERKAKTRDAIKKVIIGTVGLEIANKLGITKLLGF